MSEARDENPAMQRTPLTGHELLVLEGPPAVHVVERGALIVSCAETSGGVQIGPRHFLFRCGEGHALLSMPGSRGDGLRFVAVSVADAVVQQVPLDVVWDGIRATPSHGVRGVEAWIRHLVRTQQSPEPPRTAVVVGEASEVELAAGEALRGRPEDVLWVEVEAGRVRHSWDGEGLHGADGAAPLPLGPDMWVEAVEPARLRLCDTSALPDRATFEAALQAVQRRALARLARQLEMDEQSERDRLAERHDREVVRVEDALGDLAAVLNPDLAHARHVDAWLGAVSAVGEALGVPVRAPPHQNDERRVTGMAERIAHASGIRTRRVALSGAWWRRDCGPLVGRWAGDDERPVAILPNRSLRYEVYDPSDGSRRRLTPRVASQLDHGALALYRPLPEGRLGLGSLLRFSLKGAGRDLVYVFVTGILVTLLGMLTPQATAVLMDHAIPEADGRLLLELGLALLAASFGQALFGLAQGFVLTRFSMVTEAQGQAGLWSRLLDLRPSFFRGYSTGDMQSRVMAVNEVGRELSGATLTAGFSGLLALLNLGLLFYYSSRLALLAVVVALLTLLVTVTLGARIQKRVRVLQELRGRCYGFILQIVQGVSKLRVAGAEGRAYTQWVRRYTKQMKLTEMTQRDGDVIGVFNTVLPLLSTALLFWLGFSGLASGNTADVGDFSIGIFLAFYIAFGTFLGGATTLSNTVVDLLDTFAKGRRIRPLLEAEPEVDRSRADPGELSGCLALENVVFRYREDGPKILDSVSLRAEPGEFVALVGGSGSGKSTIFRVLLGFETPEAGVVAYDGKDLAGLDVRAVRRAIGVVLQAGRLSAGSIFDNVAAGTAITLDDAWEAIRAAGMGDEVEMLPMGLHTVISEGGGNLSGGQRQRLLIARALALRPRILFFDEATSALDNRSQEVVSRSLGERRITRLVIAHRLSTIRDADRIYVLEAGRVVEEGSFEDLRRAGGVFARMMARQMV